MLSAFRKRLSRIEADLPVPVTAEGFYARACRHAQRIGASVGTAMEELCKELSDVDLERLTAEFEYIAFGDDTGARDAAKREVFAAAGYPDWTQPQEAK